jgi:pimeloyl-ACP methyl ester carboxylesterase
MFLQRRGYGNSGVGDVNERTMGAVEAHDVERAIAAAAKLGDGGKVGVLGYSLGGMIMPELDPAKVAWLALLNPGVPGMLERMAPEVQAGAQMLRAGYEFAKYMLPWQREAAIQSVITEQVRDFKDRITAQAGAGQEPLAQRLIEDLERRMRDPRLRELWLQETLWAGFGPHEVVSQKVPTLAYLNSADETVPKKAYDDLIRLLSRTAAALRVVHAGGGHLSPVFEPRPVRAAVEDFDRAH